MLKMCKVSIIVPVHDSERYLRACVASLTAQTHRDIEIVLVENASSDSSLELCRKLSETDSRIKVLHLDLGDPAYARNEGIRASEGEYIGFVDSDDTVDPDMYEQMLKLAVDKGLDVVICDLVKKYDYRSDRVEYVNDGKVTVASPMDFLKKNFKDQIAQSACTVLCRRELFDKVQFPVGRYYEDTATTWRLLQAARTAGHIARPFYHYYRHSGSIVHTASFKIHYGHVLADIERVDFINSCPEFSEAERQDLASRPMALFYRHFKKMVKLAETEEEKEICRNCRDWAMSVPDGYRLKFRYNMIRISVCRCWKMFCLLQRREIL